MDSATFSFITPKLLRDNIVESVEFAGFLWVLAQEVDAEQQDEMTRTIILYNIAIIEALLLFWTKKQRIKFYEEKWSHSSVLPNEFQNPDRTMVIAYYTKTERAESRIWLHELIMKNSEFLGPALRKKVSDLQNIRNTFHLSRKRRVLSLRKAEDSFDIVLKVVGKIQKELPPNA